MNGDLERTLEELGPEYRAVVARLRSSREVEPGRFGLKGLAPRRQRQGPRGKTIALRDSRQDDSRVRARHGDNF